MSEKTGKDYNKLLIAKGTVHYESLSEKGKTLCGKRAYPQELMPVCHSCEISIENTNFMEKIRLMIG